MTSSERQKILDKATAHVHSVMRDIRQRRLKERGYGGSPMVDSNFNSASFFRGVNFVLEMLKEKP